MKKALICGISGQDGAYLAKLLLEKGYIVIGTSRDAQLSSFSNLQKLGIYEKITFETMALNDYRSVLNVVMNTLPDEIYNLAGQTYVALSTAS
jgi:GDPmannose 4,6-dehydratase